MFIMYKLAPEGFSFHTFELQKSITYEEYRSISDLIYKHAVGDRKKAFPEGNIIVCLIWAHRGIRVFLHENNTTPPHLRLIINPRNVIDGYNPICIFQYNQENIETVKSYIDYVLSSLNCKHKFDDMTLSRIDLCVNVDFQDIASREEYMRLFSKCYITNLYERSNFDKHVENYKEKNKHSFRAENGRVKITIYDKIFQLKQEKKLDSSCNMKPTILRFEVSISRPVIIKYGRKYLDNDTISNLHLLQIFSEHCKEIMKGYIFDFFPHGIYLKYNILKDFIRSVDTTNKIKDRMIYLMQKASGCNDLNKATDKLRDEFNLDWWKTQYILSIFEQNGVNPVALPNTSMNLALPGIRSVLGYEEKPAFFGLDL